MYLLSISVSTHIYSCLCLLPSWCRCIPTKPSITALCVGWHSPVSIVHYAQNVRVQVGGWMTAVTWQTRQRRRGDGASAELRSPGRVETPAAGLPFPVAASHAVLALAAGRVLLWTTVHSDITGSALQFWHHRCTSIFTKSPKFKAPTSALIL